jgi:hypothetical protein
VFLWMWLGLYYAANRAWQGACSRHQAVVRLVVEGWASVGSVRCMSGLLTCSHVHSAFFLYSLYFVGSQDRTVTLGGGTTACCSLVAGGDLL